MLQTTVKNARITAESAGPGKDPRAGKYLSFRLGKEDYAIKVKHIREIMGVQEITPLPEMPSYIKGVMNLRGKMIPLIDMRVKLGLPDVEYTAKTCVLVVQVDNAGGTLTYGGVVDGVSEVLTLGDLDIDDIADFRKDGQLSGLLGTAKIKNRLRNLLDVNLVLTPPELRVLESCKEIQVHVPARDDNPDALQTGRQLA